MSFQKTVLALLFAVSLSAVAQGAGGSTANLDQIRAAAEQGNAEAQSNLGVMYEEGRGVAKDRVQANAWYRKAAEQGYAEAQVKLGNNLRIGWGVGLDREQAVVWYRKAADQGNVVAQFWLAECYSNGLGVAKDKAQAVALHRKAAAQGYTPSISALALLKALGE